MAKKMDAVVIVDVEATCYAKGTEPAGFISEIIEIGVCLLDLDTLERSAKRSIVVKPLFSEVGPFCTDLTGFTQEAVDKGISFPMAVEIIKHEYLIGIRAWASYGDYDRKMFERDAATSVIPYPFSPTHTSVKNLVASAFGWPEEVGMAKALKKLGLPLEGRHHSGADDSWNIAAILAKIFHQARMGGATA